LESFGEPISVESGRIRPRAPRGLISQISVTCMTVPNCGAPAVSVGEVKG